MKGIAHFSTGIAVASCFPQAVEAGAAGNPLYFLIGGIFGLMPDTLDFKLCRFLYKHDAEIVPDPLQPDPAAIAEGLARAARNARIEGKPVRVKLATIRLATDAWQRYTVRFGGDDGTIGVTYGPVVDTGGHATAPAPPRRHRRAEIAVGMPIHSSYMAETEIDAFDGPAFAFVPGTNGGIRVDFIPWHRQWTHSVTAALAAAALAGAIWGWAAGAIAGGALLAHVLADQLGFLGSNLFYPLTQHRTPGMKLLRSADALPNLLAVWLSCWVTFVNLSGGRFPGLGAMSTLRLAVAGAALPLAAAYAWKRLFAPRANRRAVRGRTAHRSPRETRRS